DLNLTPMPHRGAPTQNDCPTHSFGIDTVVEWAVPTLLGYHLTVAGSPLYKVRTKAMIFHACSWSIASLNAGIFPRPSMICASRFASEPSPVCQTSSVRLGPIPPPPCVP